MTSSRIGYTYPSATPTGRGAHVLDSIGAADPRAWHVRCRRPSVRIYTRRRDHLPALVAWCPTYSVLLYTPRLLLRNFRADSARTFRPFSSTSPSRLGKFLALPNGQSSRGPHTYVHGTGVLVALVAVVMCATVSMVASVASGGQCLGGLLLCLLCTSTASMVSTFASGFTGGTGGQSPRPPWWWRWWSPVSRWWPPSRPRWWSPN